MREGWARDYRRRLGETARRLMYEGGKPWIDALAEAEKLLQCGAKTKTGEPCKRAGRNPRTHRCEKHGASQGANTPEGRERLRQKALVQPRINGRRFATRAQVEAAIRKAAEART